MGPKVARRRRRLAEQIASEPSGIGTFTKSEVLAMIHFAISAMRSPKSDASDLAEATRLATAAGAWWAASEAAVRDAGGVVIPDEHDEQRDAHDEQVAEELAQLAPLAPAGLSYNEILRRRFVAEHEERT